MKKLSVLILFAFIMYGCNKAGTESVTPKCVEDKIKNFNTPSICKDVKVDEYRFQGQTVYLFDSEICGADMASEVINSECITMGYLGGIIGNTKINGEEFSNATFIKTIWKK